MEHVGCIMVINTKISYTTHTHKHVILLMISNPGVNKNVSNLIRKHKNYTIQIKVSVPPMWSDA